MTIITGQSINLMIKGGGMFAGKVMGIAVLALGLAAVSSAFAEPALTMRIDDNHSVKDWTRVADIFF